MSPWPSRVQGIRQWLGTAPRGKVTLLLLGLPLIISTSLSGWFIRRELPYTNWQAYVLPLAGERLVMRHDAKGSGRFGASRSGHRAHNGIDLVGQMGEPVYAVRSGRVVTAQQHAGLGRYIEIDHGGDLVSRYAHLSDYFVRAGQRVRQGDLIGTVGKSGNARSRVIAAHVHFELRRHDEPFDPMSIQVFQRHVFDSSP